MNLPVRRPVSVVIEQHAEDAVVLHSTRTALASAPHVTLEHLQRFDDRLAAHLDGLLVAGEPGWQAARARLASLGASEAFVCAVLALRRGQDRELAAMWALARSEPAALEGVQGALRWVRPGRLEGIVAGWLHSRDPFLLGLALGACSAHGVDPGDTLPEALRLPDAGLRREALRSAGELGRVDLLPMCRAALQDADDACRLEAAAAAVLLGHRGDALACLREAAGSRLDRRAAQWVVQAGGPEAAGLLQSLSAAPDGRRLLVEAIGWSGKARHLPWLIELMGDAAFARLAGAAFSAITGADLAELDLEGGPLTGGPAADDTEGDDSDIDIDLPWPNREAVATWYAARQTEFGRTERLLLGAPVSPEACLSALARGCQLQRHSAALHLALMQPGSGLFDCTAPARRQLERLRERNGAAASR
ncbi:TIGR02270 family protein [Aquabacterium sp. A7-Y]|uniref:TIGR02270 family protein n=1 Tax=Aquabacterium sp. A7-Y TaxID=1349605 RepID=UPI00223D6EDF|nr:TIGR02270 family protein [Aquabacterium sp. A7-Y]MCW7541891.1 TIGR02270 family protein [Aquabacterium sp. A7-Y]